MPRTKAPAQVLAELLLARSRKALARNLRSDVAPSAGEVPVEEMAAAGQTSTPRRRAHIIDALGSLVHRRDEVREWHHDSARSFPWPRPLW